MIVAWNWGPAPFVPERCLSPFPAGAATANFFELVEGAGMSALLVVASVALIVTVLYDGFEAILLAQAGEPAIPDRPVLLPGDMASLGRTSPGG